MDDKDRQILRLLQEDARTSQATIGERVGLSAASVNERIRRLVNDEVILGFTVEVDDGKAGIDITAFIDVFIESPRHEPAFVALMEELPAVQECHFVTGDFKQVPRPGHRDWRGHVDATLQQMNQRELALGSKSRSGQQWDIWEAVYSPVGPDGYPQRIWDKTSGVIDPEVAAHWRENYDLRHILERDWSKLGSSLQGKLHVYVGDMDNYYLNNAVRHLEEFLERTSEPYYGGEVVYERNAPHCWGPSTRELIEKMTAHIRRTSPAGADLTSWTY